MIFVAGFCLSIQDVPSGGAHKDPSPYRKDFDPGIKDREEPDTAFPFPAIHQDKPAKRRNYPERHRSNKYPEYPEFSEAKRNAIPNSWNDTRTLYRDDPEYANDIGKYI